VRPRFPLFTRSCWWRWSIWRCFWQYSSSSSALNCGWNWTPCCWRRRATGLSPFQGCWCSRWRPQIPGDRDQLLARFTSAYGVTFHLFDNEGEFIAGPRIELPEPVVERIHRRPPGLGDEPPPPKRRPEPDWDPAEKKGRGPGKGKGPPVRGAPPPFLVSTDGLYWVGVRMPLRGPDDEGRPPLPTTLLLTSSALLTNPFFFDPKPWVGVAARCWWYQYCAGCRSFAG